MEARSSISTTVNIADMMTAHTMPMISHRCRHLPNCIEYIDHTMPMTSAFCASTCFNAAPRFASATRADLTHGYLPSAAGVWQ